MSLENNERSEDLLQDNDHSPLIEQENNNTNNNESQQTPAGNSQPHIQQTQPPPSTGHFNRDVPNSNVNPTDPHYNKDDYRKSAFNNNTLSSLPLQMLVYFHYHYCVLFFILNLCLFTYKAIKFYYPGRFLGWELTTIFVYLVINQTRLFMTSKGNKTGSSNPFVLALLLAIPIVILYAYYIALQTYVLRVDLVINAIGFILLGFEVFISAINLLNLYLLSRRI